MVPSPAVATASRNRGARPDLRQWGHILRAAERWQAVHILDGAKQLVMVEPLGVDARPHVRADDYRRNRLDCPARVLVEGDDEQAVVAGRPARVLAEVLLHPAVASPDRAVVHVVAHIRAHERHSRQLAIVAREGAERLVRASRQRAEVDPRVVLAEVPTR
jgi:hypothetical protein